MTIWRVLESMYFLSGGVDVLALKLILPWLLVFQVFITSLGATGAKKKRIDDSAVVALLELSTSSEQHKDVDGKGKGPAVEPSKNKRKRQRKNNAGALVIYDKY